MEECENLKMAQCENGVADFERSLNAERREDAEEGISDVMMR